MQIGDLVLYKVRSSDRRNTLAWMRVLCEVKEVKAVFGREDLLIAPVSGDGELRVSSGSVEAAAEAIATTNQEKGEQ